MTSRPEESTNDRIARLGFTKRKLTSNTWEYSSDDLVFVGNLQACNAWLDELEGVES